MIGFLEWKDAISLFALCFPYGDAPFHRERETALRSEISFQNRFNERLTERAFFLVRSPGRQIHVRDVVTCYHLLRILRRTRRAISCAMVDSVSGQNNASVHRDAVRDSSGWVSRTWRNMRNVLSRVCICGAVRETSIEYSINLIGELVCWVSNVCSILVNVDRIINLLSFDARKEMTDQGRNIFCNREYSTAN